MRNKCIVAILLTIGLALSANASENTSIYSGLRHGVITIAQSSADTADLTSSSNVDGSVTGYYAITPVNAHQTVTLSTTFSVNGATAKLVFIRYWTDGSKYYPESTSSSTATAQAWTINSRYAGNALDFDTGAYPGFAVAISTISTGNVTVAWSIR